MRRMLAPLLCLLLALCALTATTGRATDTATQPTLSAFRATYTSQTDLNMGFTGEATRELKQLDNGQWEFRAEANALLATQKERSQFRYNTGVVRPEQYRYRRDVLGRERRVDLAFDWHTQRVTTTVENQPWQMAIAPGTQDKLSYQLQLRLDLQNGLREFAYQVADGGKMKTYRFQVIGEERITTPYGVFDTLKVERVRDDDGERVTHIWFAPSLDYMVVRLYQNEADGKEYGLLLKTLEFK